MSKIGQTAGLGFATLLFLGAPLAFETGGAAVLDIWSSICGVATPVVAGDASGGSVTDEHQNMEATGGLYMPMFSTPPKGGKVYNGPPLDEC